MLQLPRETDIISYLTEINNYGEKRQKFEVYELVDNMIDKVYLVLDQEYFYLHNCELYDELYDFANNDLTNIYDNKIDASYRYGTNDYPSVADDYMMVMTKLNTLINQYI